MKGKRITTPAGRDFDLTFRPDYWQPSDPISLIIANVKGEERRRQILDVLRHEHRIRPPGTELPEALLRDSLCEDDRIVWGQVDPTWMGGEYLPDYARGEMEIARIVLASVTRDVVSIRARRSRNLRIHFRVVDEYGTTFAFRPRSSPRPLTLAEVIGLLESIRSGDEWDGLTWIEAARARNYDGDPVRVAHFAIVESPFYPRLHDYYAWRNARWLDRERARIAGLPGRSAGEEAAP